MPIPLLVPHDNSEFKKSAWSIDKYVKPIQQADIKKFALFPFFILPSNPQPALIKAAVLNQFIHIAALKAVKVA